MEWALWMLVWNCLLLHVRCWVSEAAACQWSLLQPVCLSEVLVVVGSVGLTRGC